MTLYICEAYLKTYMFQWTQHWTPQTGSQKTFSDKHFLHRHAVIYYLLMVFITSLWWMSLIPCDTCTCVPVESDRKLFNELILWRCVHGQSYVSILYAVFVLLWYMQVQSARWSHCLYTNHQDTTLCQCVCVCYSTPPPAELSTEPKPGYGFSSSRSHESTVRVPAGLEAVVSPSVWLWSRVKYQQISDGWDTNILNPQRLNPEN